MSDCSFIKSFLQEYHSTLLVCKIKSHVLQWTSCRPFDPKYKCLWNSIQCFFSLLSKSNFRILFTLSWSNAHLFLSCSSCRSSGAQDRVGTSSNILSSVSRRCGCLPFLFRPEPLTPLGGLGLLHKCKL